MKLGLYTYGNPIMGIGHIYRCLILADQARVRWPEVDICFELKAYDAGIRIVREWGHVPRVWSLEESPKGKWDVLVVDQLQVTQKEMQKLAVQTKCLVSLDDAGAGHYQAHLAFNTLYRCRAARPTTSFTQTHLGLEFLILDPKFASQPYEVRPAVKHLFLSQGGSDTYGVVPKLICDLTPWLEAHPEITLHVHTGPTFRFVTQLQTVLEGLSTTFKWNRRVADFPAFMASMDLAISAVGMMACELAAVGVPSILITKEKKELETASMFQEQGMAINLENYEKGCRDRLHGALNLLTRTTNRAKLSETTRRLIDGCGAKRILAAIEPFLYKNKSPD